MRISTTRFHLQLIRRSGFCVLVEFKPQDAWIGAFWKRTHQCRVDTATEATTAIPYLDLWVCLLPMVPLHFCFAGAEKPVNSFMELAKA